MTPCLYPRRLFGFALRLALGLLLLVGVTAARSAADEIVLAELNGSGFDYTFDNFNQTIGPQSVRITDPIDGWGGAGVVPASSLNLSSLADGRLLIDFTPEAGNLASDFTIELIEQNTGGQTLKSGKWTFSLAGLEAGVPTQVASTSRLSEPQSGIGDFGNLDLSSIVQWQVLGAFGSPDPFDVSFDRIAVSTDAPAYPGAEDDAAWRTVAANRIDANRKANLSISVVDAAGLPVPGARVAVEMQKHEFGFGSAVTAFRLRDDSPQHATYRSKVAELFNAATLENNLKWQPWEGEWGNSFTQQGALNALDWLADQGIEARGHVMVWPGEDNLPADIRSLLSDGNLTPSEQQTVRDRIAVHLAEIGGGTDGKVVAWDVINETRTNNDLMRELSEGDQAMVTWFQQARSAAPNAALYMNDFGILNSWGRDANRDTYYNTLQTLQQQGAEIDGVGFQGHFREGDIVGPEELWSVLDRFDELGLDMQVTEFDFDSSDEQLQAQYTRDFITAMFAHEGIDDFLFWGFWEDAHWRPSAALFRSDWSIKPNGQAFLDLVFDEWWTEEQADADAEGASMVRAFKGDHRVTATAGAASSAEEISLLGDGSVVITLAILVGDYNDDGQVDAADYTVWRTALATQDLSADGNNDGIVDSADYDIWASRFGVVKPGNVAQVPEPSSILLLSWLMLKPRR